MGTQVLSQGTGIYDVGCHQCAMVLGIDILSFSVDTSVARVAGQNGIS